VPKRRAEVRTASGSRYLQQLCKHWGHKLKVEFTPSHGEIGLPFGPCVLDADDAQLTIVIASDDPAALPRFQSVVEEHINRFAFRETLAFAWVALEADA
jgi:uncharacterized protein